MSRSPDAREERAATPPLSSEQRRDRIHAMLLPLGFVGAIVGFAVNGAVDFLQRTVDFALHAVEVPATVVGVHRGSPEVEFTVGRDLARAVVTSGHHEPGSPLDITLYQHSADQTMVSVHHPLATYGWFPLAVLLAITGLGAVLTVQRLRRFRARLRLAAHERGGGRARTALWRPVLLWAVPALTAFGLGSVILVLVSNTANPSAAWTGIGFALYACGLPLAVEAWLSHAEHAPAPARPTEPAPPRGVPFLVGALVALPALALLTVIGLAVHDDFRNRMVGHDSVALTARIVESSTHESRSGCVGSLIVTYEVDGLPYTSVARTDCDTAEVAVRFADIELVRSVDDPSLIALPENVL